MQKSDTPGNRHTQLNLKLYLRSIIPAFLFILIAGITNDAKAVPPGVPDFTNPNTRLVVLDDSAKADGTESNIVRAYVYDDLNNPVVGVVVAFTTIPGGVTYPIITNASGYADFVFSRFTVGQIEVDARIGAIHFSPTVTVTFVALPPDPDQSVLIVTQDGAAADGVAQNTVRAHIVDKYGEPLAGQTITFSYLGDATPGGPLTITTDALGNATLSFTSSTAGPVVITATVNGIPLINGNPSTVHFVISTDPDNPLTQLSTIDDNAIADGSSTNSVRAHVVDNAGNPMAGITVVFTIASGDGTMVTPQTLTTDANGDAFLLISSNKTGFVTVTATADGKNIQFGSPARVRPKVFTPNGDGVNDMVRAIANGISLQYFNIYNRWGNLLFTTTDLNQGWDGRFKGVVQPNETYLWIVVGRTNSTNERVQRRGMITLVK